MDLSANHQDQMESDHEDMDIEEEPAFTSDDDSEHSDFNPEAESETESKKESMVRRQFTVTAKVHHFLVQNAPAFQCVSCLQTCRPAVSSKETSTMIEVRTICKIQKISQACESLVKPATDAWDKDVNSEEIVPSCVSLLEKM
ncbi:uncharacterized protein [Montipora foliosa]|uniref:uncharacterized protein n=1 Tax=Montipora foliosa TaxID=591990 RepID=UPI0035F1301E